MNKNPVDFFSVDDVHGLYVDAFVQDCKTGNLLFASFWGRDTSMQELQARLSLLPSEGGLQSLILKNCDDESRRYRLSIPDPEQLSKLTGRMPASNLFGAVAHLWLYVRQAVEPDFPARRALLLLTDGAVDLQDVLRNNAVWQLLTTISHLPLLNHWRDVVMDVAVEKGWVVFHKGLAVHAVELNLGDDFESTITGLIKQGRLRVDETAEIPMVSELRPDLEIAHAEAKPERLTSEQLDQALAQFTGTTAWYRHWLAKNLTYTDGVQFFAEEGGNQGAYWFIDIVATEFFPLLDKVPFMDILLSVNRAKAHITVSNGNGREVRKKDIEYTDMQDGDWRFYLTNNVLLLPREY